MFKKKNTKELEAVYLTQMIPYVHPNHYFAMIKEKSLHQNISPSISCPQSQCFISFFLNDMINPV